MVKSSGSYSKKNKSSINYIIFPIPLPTDYWREWSVCLIGVGPEVKCITAESFKSSQQKFVNSFNIIIVTVTLTTFHLIKSG